MTPSEVQRLELALNRVTSALDTLTDRFDESEAERKTLRAEVNELQLSSARVRGAMWAGGIFWSVVLGVIAAYGLFAH